MTNQSAGGTGAPALPEGQADLAPMRRWTVEFEFTTGRREVAIAEATNAPDAFMAAITFVRQMMKPGEDFRHVRVGDPQPSDSDPNVQMPVAWSP